MGLTPDASTGEEVAMPDDPEAVLATVVQAFTQHRAGQPVDWAALWDAQTTLVLLLDADPALADRLTATVPRAELWSLAQLLRDPPALPGGC